MFPLWIFASSALALAAAAAVTDARTGHIPNALTLPPLAIGPLVHGLFGGWQAAALSLAAAVACGLLPYAMFRKGAAGGGDVKLLAALGALGGIGIGLEAQLFGFAVAAIASLVKLAWHGQLWRTFANAARLAVNPVLPGRLRRPIAPEAMATIRLGVPILAGTALAVWVRLPLLGIGV